MIEDDEIAPLAGAQKEPASSPCRKRRAEESPSKDDLTVGAEATMSIEGSRIGSSLKGSPVSSTLPGESFMGKASSEPMPTIDTPAANNDFAIAKETALGSDTSKKSESSISRLPEVNISLSPKFSNRNGSSSSLDYGPQEDIVTFKMFTNDGEDESSVALIQLKNIFSRQLPKMPKEYIVRLVFDRRHRSLAILRNGNIIGGICYRAFYPQRFGEIAFCAISGTEQVRGYGTRLMNELKYKVQQENIEYFLTYADNYAIGYFQKQGFSKTVSMSKDRWQAFIKDYDGGTLMECYIHPNMDYRNVKAIVAKQRAFLHEIIRHFSTEHIAYPGLEMFKKGERVKSIMDVPGVMEAGWKPNMILVGNTQRDRDNAKTKLTIQLKGYIDKILASNCAWPFEMPVDPDENPEYYKKIDHPIDLTTIHERLRTGDYYRCKELLREELRMMTSNCKTFNGPGNEYYEAACNLDILVDDIFLEDGAGSKKDKKKR